MISLFREELHADIPPVLARFRLSLLALLVGVLFGSLELWAYSIERAFRLHQVYGVNYYHFLFQEARDSFLFCITLALIGWLPASPVLTLPLIARTFASASLFQALLYGGLAGFAAMSLFLVLLQLTETTGAASFWVLATTVGVATGPAYRYLLRAYRP